ncbi:hypothetical protein [Aggregatibacter aphrophilus]|uniref:hypothetical protein n=1 Tax=Aggregatibacter aphrophilus TaxID=732 RepID=UPI001EF6CD27|nr:hypothetical protein [Aggregatibacter aphrophilus]
MSEQEKQTNEQNNKIESPIIPNVAYPLKPRNNTTNLSQQYFNRLAGDETSAFLFNNSGLWHQGIHLRASQFPSSEFENDKICAIADGKLIAYKVDSEYKKDSEVEVPMKSAVYSTGYFLLKHKMAYPKDNVLTFYSLYRHTAKLSDYPPKKRYVTKSADANPVAIKDRRGVVIAQLADGLIISIKSPNSKASRHEIESYQDEQGQIHRPSNGDIWTIYKGSYHQEEDSTQHAIPFLSQNNIETEADKEVLLSGNRQIEVKAGEVLGLMGEYNQTGKSGEKLLHLEVFTYDDIEQFRAKAEAAYKQDKEKKGIKDNFLYVARGSQLYTVLKDEVVELEKTQVEIMVPLADVAKQTVKKKTDKTGKDYYNVQPYLYSLLENNNDGGIYVDDSHLTHGLLFPGVNVFKDEAHEVSIFKEKIATCADPEGTATPEEKDRLGPVFKEIWQELDVDKDSRQGEVRFEAGTLKALLTNPIIRRRLTGIIVRHKSEWSAEQEGKFEELKALMRKNNCAEKAERFGKRVADLGIKLKGEGFDSEQEAYYMHPLGLIGWLAVTGCQCGKKLINQIKCTRYGKAYGPVYRGNKKLNSYSRWDYLISTRKITQDEKSILLAMSENEGNMDAVHSYDSEILTAGAMQKTINSSGEGELPIQMFKFKQQHPSLFDKYFKCCGWDVDYVNNKYIAYYNGMTGTRLKQFLRNECSVDNYGKVVPNKAVAIFAEAVIVEEYQDLQIEDFIDRLNNKALVKKPKGYSYQIVNYVKSNLGKATVLDHDVNRPGYVGEDFAEALNYFYRNHPNISKDPSTWGEKHKDYEREIIEYYGNHRRGTDMVNRFKKLKGKL